jgi:hypothetical protein
MGTPDKMIEFLCFAYRMHHVYVQTCKLIEMTALAVVISDLIISKLAPCLNPLRFQHCTNTCN